MRSFNLQDLPSESGADLLLNLLTVLADPDAAKKIMAATEDLKKQRADVDEGLKIINAERIDIHKAIAQSKAAKREAEAALTEVTATSERLAAEHAAKVAALAAREAKLAERLRHVDNLEAQIKTDAEEMAKLKAAARERVRQAAS